MCFLALEEQVMFPIRARVIVRNKITGLLEEIGTKDFGPAAKPLSEWTDRPKAVDVRPPLSSAIVLSKEADADTLASDAIGYMMSVSNDVQNCSQGVALFSSVYFHGHGWSIIPDNFHKSMIVFTVRRLVKDTWLNHNDEFNQPNEKHKDFIQFALDAVVYALFNSKNQSSSLGNVKYKKKIYDIPNEFFWLTHAEIAQAQGMPAATLKQMQKDPERFVATWIQGKLFSPDAAEVLRLGKEMVLTSALHRNNAPVKFQLDRWDAGWAQVRQGLFAKDTTFVKTPEMIKAQEDFQTAYAALKERLRPMIYALGFLPEEKLLTPI